MQFDTMTFVGKIDSFVRRHNCASKFKQNCRLVSDVCVYFKPTGGFSIICEHCCEARRDNPQIQNRDYFIF